jgi:hypothetical protein
MIRVWRGLAWAIVVLVALSALGLWISGTFRLQQEQRSVLMLFELDGENNLPTWFSSSLLLATAAMLLVIAHRARAAGAPFARHWTFLGAAFLLMSIDEITQVHERIGKHILPFEGILGPAAFNWVFLAAALVAVVGLLYLPFLRHLPERTRRGMLVGGAIFVTGAVGVEAVSGKLVGLYGFGHLGYKIVAQLEEVLELAGSYRFARATWGHLERE